MQTLPQIFFESRKRPEHQKALLYKQDGEWRSLNWLQYYEQASAFSYHLLSAGVKKGDRVAVCSETRPEWAITDLAIQCIGAITVPVYANGNAEELEHILKDSGARLLIIDGELQRKKWLAVKDRCPAVENIFCFDDGTWKNAVQAAAKLAEENPNSVPQLILESKIDEVATIVYTSGTSGLPKGVVLTQRQIMSEITDIMKVFSVGPEDQTLSFLPYAHVLGRVEMWLSILAGYTLGFAESIDRIRANLKEIPPTVVIAVPRIFEKIYAAVATQLDRRPLLNHIFRVAGPRLKGKFLAGQIRPAFGGRLRFAISGGAPLDSEIAAFFRGAGVLVYEGYGLTETTGAITVNTPEHFKFGTVGRPLPDVGIRIADDGEILVKSDKVLTKYYSLDQPAANAEGYFPTGDIGHLDGGFLVITDRKKDLIKTSGGKYVAPQKLENALKTSPLISRALIHGDREKYIVALLTLNDPKLFNSPDVRAAIAKHVASVNAELSSYETIKRYEILDRDFTIAAGEITPSLKLKRKVCEEKYADRIEALYRST